LLAIGSGLIGYWIGVNTPRYNLQTYMYTTPGYTLPNYGIPEKVMYRVGEIGDSMLNGRSCGLCNISLGLTR
jgi:hypothetical protein